MRNVLIGIALGATLAVGAWLLLTRPEVPKISSPPTGPAEPIVATARPEPRAGSESPKQPPASRPAPASGGTATSPPPSETPRTAPPNDLVEAARRDPAGGPIDPGHTVQTKPGQLSVEAVRAGIDAARPAVKRCYEEALTRQADLGGKLMVRFVVAQHEGKGRIREADIDEEASDEAMLNPFLGMCVLKALGEIEYPAVSDGAEGEVVVRFPFQFNAQPDDPAEKE